ncbi:MAG: hypothetical protein E7292_08325 [Lachnospiraceae bacterium]|nr:hypothetical protein [Lachnospiraceae bacterium]
MKNKRLFLKAAALSLSMMALCSGCAEKTTENTQNIAESTQVVVESSSENVAESTQASAEVENSTNAEVEKAVYENYSDAIGVDSYLEKYTSKQVLKLEKYGSYVVMADELFVDVDHKEELVEVSLDAWKSGDFMNQIVEFSNNLYMNKGKDGEYYEPGELSTEAVVEFVKGKIADTDLMKEDLVLSFAYYTKPEVGDENYFSVLNVVIDENQIYVKFPKSDYCNSALPIFYIEEDNVYVKRGIDNVDSVVLEPLFISDYDNDNGITDSYELRKVRYAPELKVNGEHVDYIGNVEALFTLYNYDASMIETEWAKEGRYAKHADGSSCTRLAYIYDVIDLNELGKAPFVEWIGVQIMPISECENCTNHVEYAGIDIDALTEFNAQDLWQQIYDMQCYAGYGEWKEKSLRVTTKDNVYETRNNINNLYTHYCIEYDKVYGTDKFTETLVDRNIEYK